MIDGMLAKLAQSGGLGAAVAQFQELNRQYTEHLATVAANTGAISAHLAALQQQLAELGRGQAELLRQLGQLGQGQADLLSVVTKMAEASAHCAAASASC